MVYRRPSFGIITLIAMKLPNGDRAVVNIAKLRDYCLNPRHEDGKHKARMFESALGLTGADADWLREQLLQAAASEPASVLSETRFGTLYVLDFLLTTVAGTAVARSGWIIRYGEDFPRLTTCYLTSGAKR